MGSLCAFVFFLFLGVVFPYGSWCLPTETSVDCGSGSDIRLGEITEGYEGAVETLVGIPTEESLTLEIHLYPIGITFLRLEYTAGDTNATVWTRKALDADALSGGLLSYAIQCTRSGAPNVRKLTVRDVNDNSPVFQKTEYNATISETLSVGSSVLKVVATDADVDNGNNQLTYTIQDPVPSVFEMRVDGLIQVKTRLNYNTGDRYTFTVRASDPGGRSDTATVNVEVTDYDNLNPYFDHSLYEAAIEENMVGPLSVVQPAAIKAQDADTGINEPIMYSITAVSPSKYLANFSIDANTGVISLATPLDREEVSTVNVQIMAAQQDDDTKTANAIVVVTINDVKDNPPEFDKADYSASLQENSPAASFVLQFKVTDKDQGGFVGTFQLIPDTVPFTVSDDGIIRVKTPADLDRETTRNFQFQVEAREDDPPNHTATANVNISLTDVNDNSPQFGNGNYEGKVFSNQTVGMLVVKVEASDSDDGVNGQVTYSITGGNQDDLFGIDENSGEITLLKIITLQENEILRFPLYVTAKDGGDIPRASSVLVDIRAPGDDRPQFLQRTYNGSVDEEMDGPVQVVKVTFRTIGQVPQVDTEGDKFSIDNQGMLSTKVKLDYETQASYTVRVSLSDGTNRDEAVVEVAVKDVNDHSPAFASSSITFDVSEDAVVGENITTVTASDADAGYNGEVRYSLQGGAGRFSVNVESGMLSVAEPLDREQQDEIHLEVIAVDMGQPARSATASVVVKVLDVNDNKPVFSPAQYSVTTSELNGPGTFLTNLTAEDLDMGINAAITYRITKQEPTSGSPVFMVDAASGALTLAQKLDYSNISSYVLTVEAVDGGTPALTGSATVTVQVEDVNNNPPEFSREHYNVAVPENLAVGIALVSLEVTDKDKGGFVGTFRLIPDTVPFAVSDDGIIRVKTPADLDRETTSSFQFQVEAREDDPPNHTATANVNISLTDVNDNSPQFGNANYEGKVFSNQTVGMLVVKVEASDPDDGVNGQVTYSITGGNQDDFFGIDENSGEITLLKIITLQENEILRFPLYVTAKDGGDIPRASSVLVDIRAPGDDRPQFLQRTYNGSVDEEMDGPVQVVKVTFRSTGQVPQVDTEGDKFSIDNQGMLSTKVKLDYETQANYTVRVSLSDGTNRDEAVVEVAVKDVNDHSPAFASSSITFDVSEDAVVGENITTVTASDADAGYNGEVRYSLQGGAGRFSVNVESGMLSVAEPLDREQQDEIHLEVIAVDMGQPARSATASVVVKVLDVNDNKPVFSPAQYYVTTSELNGPGTFLTNLTAEDSDMGINAAITYRITKQEPTSGSPVFMVDAASGALTLAQKLDYSNISSYVLTVEAVDGGTPALTGSATVTVQVEDVNNNPPEFSRERYDVAVPENLAGGAVLVSLEVTDKDKDGFSNGYFDMTSDTFSINKMGAISLKSDATLDREKQDHYVLQVTAVDQLVNGLNTTAEVNITVTDINDNNPMFLPLPTPIVVAEGKYTAHAPGVVCRIQAEDKDAGENGRVTISTSSFTEIFNVTEDGTLEALSELDREAVDSYDLVIIATDHGEPQRQTVTNIRVSVTDVNDNAPVFSTNTYSTKILSKDGKAGDLVLTVQATDKDAGNNSVITYSFTSGVSSFLSLNGETGDITLTSDLAGVTKETLLNLTVRAEDKGKTPLSSTATVLINIRIVSLEEGLVFGSPTYNFSVPENKPKDTVVGAVIATSGSELYDINYALKTHTDLFSVDASGSIRSLVELNKETKEFYILSIEATDTRTPPTTAQTVVTVQVEDLNEAPSFEALPDPAEVFDIAPFKSPVIKLKATDPDVGDTLQYSLMDLTSMFGVDPSSGQVYVVSLAGESGKMSLTVKAEDQGGLYSTATVEVTVKETEDGNIVVISVTQPINKVEEKTAELEKSLEGVLGWKVRIISISSRNSGVSELSLHGSRSSKTYISFVALETSGTIVSAKEVQNKLKEEEQKVQDELEKVFDTDLEHEVEENPGESGSDSITVILVLGILLGLTVVGLVVSVTVSVIKFRRMKKYQGDSEQDSFGIKRMSQSSSGSDESEPDKETKGQSSPESQRKVSQDSKKVNKTREEEDEDEEHEEEEEKEERL